MLASADSPLGGLPVSWVSAGESRPCVGGPHTTCLRLAVFSSTDREKAVSPLQVRSRSAACPTFCTQGVHALRRPLLSCLFAASLFGSAVSFLSPLSPAAAPDDTRRLQRRRISTTEKRDECPSDLPTRADAASRKEKATSFSERLFKSASGGCTQRQRLRLRAARPTSPHRRRRLRSSAPECELGLRRRCALKGGAFNPSLQSPD